MKRKFKIIKFAEYSKVQYYSVQIENEQEAETELFFQAYEKSAPALRKKLIELHSWIKNIGENTTARKELFRKENAAKALPPPFSYTGQPYEGERVLRLYCIWMSETVVILLNGAEKTHKNPLKCPHCKEHFLTANKIGSRIENLLNQGVIVLKEKKLVFKNGKNTLEI